MRSFTLFPGGMSEIQRLQSLLPSRMRELVVIRSNKANSALISTTKVGGERFVVQINLKRWQQMQVYQRNLLFWHEIARIEKRTINQFPWELVCLGVGVCTSLVELGAQNLLSLTIALVVVGLAANQLYQRYWGEQSFQTATAADQDAIHLAMNYGYSFSLAYSSLHIALKQLAEQTSQKLQQRRYQVRLQVLEICATKKQPLQQLLKEIGVTSNQKQDPSLNFSPYHLWYRRFGLTVQDNCWYG